MSVAVTSKHPGTSEGRSRIGVRLLVVTVMAGLVFSVLSTLVRGGFAYMDERDALVVELTQVQDIIRPALAKAIWELDRGSVKVHLDSAARLSALGQVEVTILMADAPPEIHTRTRPDWSLDASLPVLRQSLVYSPYPEAREVVGELAVFANGRELQRRLYREIAIIFATQLLQSLLLAGFVMWMFNRSVTRHVRDVAAHLDVLSPETLSRKLALRDKMNQNDELDQLAGGVNELQRRLRGHLAQQAQYEGELSRHRDHLAELVGERTRELEAANQKLGELSRSDALTGVSNRRHFDECTEIEFRRARRTHEALSLVICDIDYFKRFNDTYGHVAGDDCLRRVAAALAGGCRRGGDVLARVGGEEFVVLLPGMGAAEAVRCAERLRAGVLALGIVHSASDVAASVSISVGVAVLDPSRMESFDAFYHCADKALYRAKALGRNRVVCWEGEE
ncbi:diguanylate cyclase [Zoogloeaceae bacterium G21618-S1]|nr:diguanylate cyclase [Zoogloeaceae bacterium G21618-S1]